MTTNRIFTVCALAAMLVCNGCWALWFAGGAVTGAGVAVGVTSYIDGSLKASLDHPPPDVAKATEQAFATLGIAKISSNSSLLTAEIIGRTAKDERVRVVADAFGDKGSSMTIRIGLFGNEAESMRIYYEIRKNLEKPVSPKQNPA